VRSTGRTSVRFPGARRPRNFRRVLK
jgi:hypothetical protein